MLVSTLAPGCSCPPPRTGPPPPPAPVPPGPARDFSGFEFAIASTPPWRGMATFGLRAGYRVGSETGYGTWSEAVAAAAQLSANGEGAIAICDDRDRLYLYVVQVGFPCGRPLHLGSLGESGYAFVDASVRGLVEGGVLVSRGDCLVRWVPLPLR